MAGRWLIALAAGVMVMSLSACGPQGEGDVYEPLPDAQQMHKFDEVKQRVDRLRPGMNKLQVLALLGSPAVQEYDHWDYMPDHSGLVLPAQLMRVEFDGGRYVRHRFLPIVLGETIGN